MPHITADAVEQEHTGFTGTGEYTDSGASAPTARRTVTSVMATGDTSYFVAVGRDSSGADAGGIEIFLGTKTATGLARTTIIYSSNANAAVNWTGVAKVAVMLTAPASRLLQLDNNRNIPLAETLAEPAAPASGLSMFVRLRANRRLLTIMDPDGIDTVLQPQLWGSRVMLMLPGSGTTLGSFGLAPTTAATLSHPAPATTSLAESLYRTRFSCSTTAGNASGARDAVNSVWRGNAAGAGGFFSHVRFCSGSISLAGGQKIVGFSSSTAALGGEPSALADVLGMLKDTGDTNWQFARRTGSGTVQKVNLGVAVANNQVFDLTIYCPPNGSTIYVRIVQYTSIGGAQTVLLDTSYTTDIPAAATLLGRHFQVRNGTTAAADNLDLVRWYLESDF